MSSNIRVNRICQYCQNAFEARTTVTKYCSLTCAGRAYKANKLKEKISGSDAQTKQIKEKPLEEIRIREILTVGQATSLLNSSTRTIYNLIASGMIKAIKVSPRKTLILRAHIDMLFEAKAPPVDLRSKAKQTRVGITGYYRMGEIQAKYGISEKALFNLINRNGIPKIPKGRYVYVPMSPIDEIFNIKK